MKVLMYIPQPGPTRAPEVAVNLAKLGNEVIAISPPGRQMIEIGVNIKPIRFTTIPIVGPVCLVGFALISAMLTIARRKPDVIYTLGGSMATGLLLSKLFRCPLITEVNGWGRAEMKLISKDPVSLLISRISRWMDEREIKHSKHLIVVAAGIKKAIMSCLKVNPGKISVIQNGADIELFKPISDAKKSLGLNSDFYYVGFSGGFNAWHSLEGLIKSAPLILEQIPNAKFLLVGEGPTKSKILNMIKELELTEQFIFIGTVPYTQVPQYVNAMDVCVILKRTDIPGSPLKLYEYMACGRPVVVTNDTDFDIVKKLKAGILVDPENPAEIASAIIGLLRNDGLREQMGNDGRKYVLECRTWEQVAREIEEAIKAAIGQQR